MSLEPSVLNNDAIRELLASRYDIHPVHIQKLPLGTANCYRVSDGSDSYFLKEFQSGFSEDQVIREAGLLDYLAPRGIPVSKFIPTATGEPVFFDQGRLFCLEVYVDGISYGYDDLPPRLLPAVGDMLGRLHAALRDYPLPLGMAGEWLQNFSGESSASGYDRLLQAAAEKPEDANRERIVADLQYKKELVLRCENYKRFYNGITYCPTHGDYQGCQLLFDGDSVAAVVDFSSAATLPVTWEIMRSFVQSSMECRKTAHIDIDKLCGYVESYRRHAPLTEADLRAMPYVYLLQLARSKYGYPQYLNGASEDRLGLLDFACWRTQICRELEEKAEKISQTLARRFS